MKRNLRKILLFCIFICFSICLTNSVYAQTNDIIISLSSVSCRPGEIVTVPIRVDNYTGIRAAHIKISFDYSELTLLSVDSTFVEDDYADYQQELISPYNIYYSNSEQNVLKEGIVAYLSFYMDENATYQDYYIGIDGEVFDEDGMELECSFTDALICCGYIPPHTHYFDDWWNSSIYEHDRTCVICGYNEYEEHKWRELERYPATTKKEGYIIYECEVCKDTKTEILPILKSDITDNPFFDWFPIIDQIYNNKSDSDKKDGTTSPSDTYTCPYTDISGHWAEDIIQFIDKLGLIDGITETEFRPDEPMTREMFVTAMARLAGIESDYVNWAIDNGVLLGYGNGEYGLTDTVTREQMAVFFLRFFEKMGIDTAKLHVRDAYAFADDETISDWAADAVYEIQSIGLIQGKENNLFDPQGTSTRAEAATVLYNLIKTITELDS